VDEMTLRIVRISDEPIATWSEDLCVPAGEVGEIVVSGPVVTREYYHRPQSTALAKVADPGRGGFWHRMGDLGYVDGAGRVWFCGRKSQRVRTAAATLFTIPCEAVFNEHPAVFRTALVGLGEPGEQRPVLCVELKPEDPGRTQAEITRELLAMGANYPHTRGIQTILFHPAFPVDIRHNAKIFREKLADWASARLE
jgi:acyl-CoA synthetase (AMP-forming)/AMP-acid ligase II